MSEFVFFLRPYMGPTQALFCPITLWVVLILTRVYNTLRVQIVVTCFTSLIVNRMYSDFVTGFHKRKKKRRKEAQTQQQEALRRKRIELRKKVNEFFCS